jgi:adenylate cyclase
MLRRSGRARRHLLLATAVGALAAALGLYAAGPLRSLELSTVDARFSVRGGRPAPRDVAVVAVDDVSFGELDHRWPFPRRLHAAVIDRLRRAGAKAIVYDVQFTERTDARNDNALVAAVARARGRIVLGTTESDARGRTRVLGGDRFVRSLGARAGSALTPNDPAGYNRRFPYAVRGLPGLAVAAHEIATGRPVPRDDFGDDGTAWIDFAGPPRTVPAYSFSRVLRGRVPAGAFRGRTVVVGASAPILHDVHPTSTTSVDLMAGAEVQANAITTLDRGLPLRPAGTLADLLAIVLLTLLPLAAVCLLRPVPAALLVVAGGLLFVVAAELAFEAGRIVAVAYPLVGLALGAVGAIWVEGATAAFERERTRDAFARFVPSQVVDQVLARADRHLGLGGVRAEATVLFCDLRGFTTYAEGLPAERVIETLNHYLPEMTEAILDHGGTLVSYSGDGIMAVFGAPIEQRDHADRAVAAVREMVGQRLERFNAWVRAEGLGDGFRIGVGLNSGPVMSGNVGSERRLEYAAIGDTTNTAARLEALTKDLGRQVLISDTTRALLRDEGAADLVYVGPATLRGKRVQVKLWALADADEHAPTVASLTVGM